jgi:hypothetical protein
VVGTKNSIAWASKEPAVPVHCHTKVEVEGKTSNRMEEIFLVKDGTCIVRQTTLCSWLIWNVGVVCVVK